MSSYGQTMVGPSGSYRKPTYDMYISNFPPTTSDTVLKESFAKFGPIAGVVIRDGHSGSKFAFVKFLCQESLDLALADTVYIGEYRIRSGPSARTQEKMRESSGCTGDAGNSAGHNSRPNQVAAASWHKPDVGSLSHQGATRHNEHNGLPSQGNKHVQLFMTHVESPCVFWAQQPALADVIANVERSLASVCSKACPIQTKPEPNKMYGTQFSFDEQWYRCELHRHISDSQSEVIYCDYGNKEVVDNDKMVELPECLMQLNPLASRYSLFGIQAVDDPELLAKGIEKLSMLKEKSVMNAILCEPHNGITQVKMRTSDGFDVNRVMLNSRTCIQVCDLDACQGSLVEHQTSENNNEPRVRRIRDGSGDRVGAGLINRLERDVKQLQQEKLYVEKLVQDLQRELKSQKQAFEAELSIAANNTFSNKMTKTLTGLQKAMSLREKLHLAADVSNPIEDAITMATGSSMQTLLDMEPVLGEIEEVRSRYLALQQKLKTASEGHDSDAIETMIAERNAIRLELFRLMQEFITLFSDVDALSSHKIQIEKLLSSLEVRYVSHLTMLATNDTDLDSSSKAYLAWKSEKLKELEDSRKTTDLMGSLVVKALGELQEELLRRSAGVDLTEVHSFDIDGLVEVYGSTIDEEIKLADEGEGSNDATIVQTTLISLTSELRSKLENMQQLTKLRARFIEECKEMNQWLYKSPDITRLQTTAKTTKTLKLRLRYRLADLQDLKENGLEKSEEFLSVEKDLEELRCLLQQQLELEDDQLKWLSVLTLNHFPEMIAKHPEFSLQKFISFGGLLKSGYMLDQFQLKPLSGCSKKYIHKSMYCGKPVVLKEFFLGMHSDATETNFLKSVKQYSELQNPHLAQLVAVFFGMNERQAVVMLPCYEFSLTQLMVDVTLWLMPDKAKVLCSVLHGISALHSINLIHGAIHPNNVLVNKSSGDVVVADYDFTKSLIQRIENPFVTSSGLKFQAPELRMGVAGCQPSYLSDMYNFGLLILWIHHPQIASVPVSRAELSSKFPDSDTARLVAYLLDEQPEHRPATDQILGFGYFNRGEPEEEHCVASMKEEAPVPSGSEDALNVRGVETAAQLVKDIVKDATEESEEEWISAEKQRLSQNSVTECNSKQDVTSAESAEYKVRDVPSGNSLQSF